MAIDSRASSPIIPRPERGLLVNWVRFLAHALFLLAAWTLFIKYLFPIGFAAARGEPLSRYVYWDFWPLIHVWVGWALIARPPYTLRLAVGVSVVEIGIIVTLLGGFLAEPEWTIWRTNWFVNKVFVLACFVCLLLTVATRWRYFSPWGSES